MSYSGCSSFAESQVVSGVWVCVVLCGRWGGGKVGQLFTCNGMPSLLTDRIYTAAFHYIEPCRYSSSYSRTSYPPSSQQWSIYTCALDIVAHLHPVSKHVRRDLMTSINSKITYSWTGRYSITNIYFTLHILQYLLHRRVRLRLCPDMSVNNYYVPLSAINHLWQVWYS